MTFTSTGFPGQLETWRQASLNYRLRFPGKSYFQDLVDTHINLGLAVKYGKAVAIAHMVCISNIEGYLHVSSF